MEREDLTGRNRNAEAPKSCALKLAVTAIGAPSRLTFFDGTYFSSPFTNSGGISFYPAQKKIPAFFTFSQTWDSIMESVCPHGHGNTTLLSSAASA